MKRAMSEDKQIEEIQVALIKISKQPIMIAELEYWSDVIAEKLYDAGYRKQSEWISVDERLPEDNSHCLVFLPSGHLYEGVHVGRYSHKSNMWVDLDTTYLYNYVTHWMPLPEAPKGKDGEGK